MLINTILIILSIIVISEAGMTIEEIKAAGKIVRNSCLTKVKITDERANELESAKFPDERDLKCYTACLLEMMSTMKNGKVNYDGTLRQIDIIFPDDLKEEYKKSITVCRDVPDAYTDNCDASYALFQCLYKNNKYFIFP